MTNNPEIGSQTRTRAILNRYHLSAKKGLGQNFLNDLAVLHAIPEIAAVSKTDDVVEIGPGIGALTEQLAQRAHQVVAFELDEELLPVLAETLAPYSNVTILHQDFLQANLPELLAKHFDGDHPIKIVANLPYYITKPILTSVMQSPVSFAAMVFMMQLEVAERVCAQPQTTDYGALSVIIQYQYEAELALHVSHKSFVPAPKVDSAIVKLIPRDGIEVTASQPDRLTGFVRSCFAHRRKTLWNNLVGLFGKQAATKARLQVILTELKIDPKLRPQALTVNQFVQLANAVQAADLKSV
ncbi:Dimethyladenosine transferase [Fructilactobacillus florum 8D]|uniref:Ribosomal RNA small subunit methyltransferase A n=1 Tax=Fructilactobacillus florum 8D TaxID=1221538 RepID=W9EE87_9LACO|nr:16S rRNA (adenine(1518)-N(6)/adenine(1519)-N(6))-dimethyltransferase RsmA [Fructilactobacillus florum]EKK20124.1 Dimethyladenosine transferase [Fructilactobacillus florum 2F]ETO40418.1 Dimethyladenosine transferase [Fructilactobacillus florum 8D]